MGVSITSKKLRKSLIITRPTRPQPLLITYSKCNQHTSARPSRKPVRLLRKDPISYCPVSKLQAMQHFYAYVCSSSRTPIPLSLCHTDKLSDSWYSIAQHIDNVWSRRTDVVVWRCCDRQDLRC